MHKELPATPADVLEISGALRLVMNAVFKSADLFGFWDSPYRNAAASFEDMTLLDKLYWAYKCRHPISRGEQGAGIDAGFFGEQQEVRLPEGFVKQGGVSLAAVGDLIPAQGLEGAKDHIYEKVADLIFDKDISYANLESPLTTQALHEEVISDKEAPIECCSLDQFQILKGHQGRNFNVIHAMGNHGFDMGREGIDTTLAVLERDGILALGANRDQSEHDQGRTLECNGIKLGFVSATYGLNGKRMPADAVHSINVARFHPKRGEPEYAFLQRQIEHCKNDGCDFVVASLHWGYEFEFFPRQHQIEIAHTIAEWGADLIIAHHPHVIQPIEYYRTQRDPDRIVPIAYSLGTLAWSFMAPHMALSTVLDVLLAKGEYQGEAKTYVQQVQPVPVFRAEVNEGDGPFIQIRKLAEVLGSVSDPEHEAYLQQMRGYVELVLGSGRLS